MSWFYISFASNIDDRFLGGCVIEVAPGSDATARLSELDIDPEPGFPCEALSVEISEEDARLLPINRLLTEAELRARAIAAGDALVGITTLARPE